MHAHWTPIEPTKSLRGKVVIVVVMGVSGSGKSTVGKILASKLGWTFVEGDDFHPPANVEKMRKGIPLDDNDRWPWLDAIHRRLEEASKRGENVVLACSALKHSYQHYLTHFTPESIRYVYLSGSEELIRQRLSQRTGHFMNPGLLHSQFETLEPPDEAIQVDIAPSPDLIAEAIRLKLGL
jgi:gluconokinase